MGGGLPSLPNYLEMIKGNEMDCMKLMTSYKTFPNIDIYKAKPEKERCSYSLVLNGVPDKKDKTLLAAALLFYFDFDGDNDQGLCLPYMTTRFGLRSHRLGEVLLAGVKHDLKQQGVRDVYVPATPHAVAFWKRNGCMNVVNKTKSQVLNACQVFSGTTLMLLKTSHQLPYQHPSIDSRQTLIDLLTVSDRFATMASSSYELASNVVDKGAKDSVRGWTLMHESVQRKKEGEAYDLTCQLIKCQASVNAEDQAFKQTPLFFASNHDHIDVIRLLVNNKADPHHRDSNHQLALFYAAKHNSLEACKFFVLECNVRANEPDWLRRSAITYATEENKKGSHTAVIEFLKTHSKTFSPIMPAKCIRTTVIQSKRRRSVTESIDVDKYDILHRNTRKTRCV